MSAARIRRRDRPANRSMTLCILTSSYPRSRSDSINAGVFVRDFALALHEAGEKVIVFTHAKAGGYEPSEPFPVVHFKWAGHETSLTSIDLKSVGGALKAVSLIRSGARQYLDACRKYSVDYSLAMWAVPSGVFARKAEKMMRIPYTVWALGSDIWSIGKSAIFKPMLARVLDQADQLFADGMQLAAEVKKISGRDCAFLPSSRDLSAWAPRPVELERGPIHALFIGRYEKNKGPDILVEAAIRALDKGGNLRFHLFGEGALEASLLRRVTESRKGNFISVGPPLDPQGVVDQMAACQCLVIPSRIESIPVIFSDALQRGLPVIASDVGDLGALIREGGVGSVVRPEDSDDLANALLKLDLAQLETMKRGIPSLASRFSSDAAAAQFLATISRTRSGFAR